MHDLQQRGLSCISPHIAQLSLIWIDLPRRQFCTGQSCLDILGQIIAAIDNYKIPLVITGSKFKSQRFVRRRDFREAIKGCLRTIHCTCKYGQTMHQRIEFSTKHLAVRSHTCTTKGADMDPIDTPDAKRMWSNMLHEWIRLHVRVPSESFVIDDYQSGSLLHPSGTSEASEVSKDRILFGKLSAASTHQSPGGAQQTPDSPFLRDGTLANNSTGITQPHCSTLTQQQPHTTSLFLSYLPDSDISCALLRPDATLPKYVSEGTYDVYIAQATTIPAGTTRIVPTGVALTLPPGTIGRVDYSSHSKLPDELSVVPGLIDHTSGEIYLALCHSGTQAYTVEGGGVVGQVSLAYPTDQKVREQEARRAAKEAGHEIVRKKKPKFVENHCDDCGEDLTSLGCSNESLLFIGSLYDENNSTAFEPTSSDSESELADTHLIQHLTYTLFYGPCAHHHCYVDNLQTVVTQNLDEFLAVTRAQHSTIDIAEVCGGEGRTSQIATRKHLKVGRNFDIVTHCDLTIDNDAKKALSYFKDNTICVAVMAPCCDCFGPLSHLNWSVNPEATQKRYNNSGPVARFCGLVALSQLQKQCEFLCEQPHPSNLYLEGVWPQVLAYEDVETVIYDRCRCGLRVERGSNKGLYLRKPSGMTVSCRELGDPFRNLRCTNRHAHLTDIGHSKEHSAAQVWTWDEAARVVTGIQNVVKRLRRGYNKSYVACYPVDRDSIARATPGGSPAPGRDTRAPPAKGSPCVGCRHYRSRDDTEHNRIVGQCAYPYDEPKIWDCDACLEHKERWHSSHTYEDGKCKWAVAPSRAGTKRKGAHPRDPASRASNEPTAGLPGNIDGAELGADAEQAIEDRALQQLEQIQESENTGGASSSSGPRRGRGPDQGERQVTTTTESGVGPINTTDWTNFDIAKSLKVLRQGTEAQKRVTLRKLHLRWWHAKPGPMKKLLERAGCPQDALDLIQPICETCPSCRAWDTPKPDAQTSLELADKFNQQVEYDILFVYKFSIFHMVDRCTRWQEAMIVDSKSEDELIDAIDVWVSRHGPPKELLGDGESGIARSAKTQEFLNRKGIKPLPRAKDQHARVAERRGALLRDVIHRIDAALLAEGIEHIPFKHRLSEACFCLNALLTINNTTPYNAVYGRVPNILPDINNPDPEHEENAPRPGQIRHVNRMREIAVQAMIDGTARARLGRAMNTRTLPAGEREGYKVGEEVDYYRPATQKDVSGWHGPAKIVDLTNLTRGIISIRSNNVVKDCRVGDVRRHLSFLCFLSNTISTFTSGPGWSQCKQIVEHLPVGQTMFLGWVYSKDTWHITKEAQAMWQTMRILLNFGTNHLRLSNIAAVRCGHGAPVGKLTGFATAVTLWWLTNDSPKVIHQESEGELADTLPGISWQRILPDRWKQIRWLQYVQTSEEAHATLKYKEVPDGASTPPATPSFRSPTSPSNSRLSTIQEENSDDVQSDEAFFSGPGISSKEDPIFYLQLQEALEEANKCCALEPCEGLDHPNSVNYASSRTDIDTNTFLNIEVLPYVEPSYMPNELVHNYHLIAANHRAGLPLNHDLDSMPTYIELGYENNMWHTIPGVPRDPQPGEVVTVLIYATGARIVNVERDDDLLSPQEIKDHHQEVNAAMLKELQTWCKFSCISRKSRQLAHNIIDCKWVLKWKWEESTLSVEASAKGETASKRRVIRARLTIRGFKDQDKGYIATYAGTSQRYSQRIICSEAVLRGWDLCTTDISKAFLQGVTYAELAELTGEPAREVNFYLPSYNIPQLRQIEGFQSFDPTREVLHCDKPGTGSVDAPRCFSLKLSKVTEKCGLVPSNIDPELCYLHESRAGKKVLVAMITKHVDDLKVTGERAAILRIMKILEEAFGELKISWHTFTNCGVRHIQCPKTKEITLDQSEYIAGLKSISSDNYSGKGSNTLCDPALHVMYQSLLGAVAFIALTRVDAVVFIVALQRYSHAPQIIHVKRLNVLVKWLQGHPQKLTYRRFEETSSSDSQHLKIIADSSFKKEEEKGHSLRGVLQVRCLGSKLDSGGTCHVLDFATKALRFVTRSTFSAELLGGCDSFDLGLMILYILHEIACGVPSKIEARTLREEGGFAVPAVLCIDALSVFAAVTATYIKAPAEKGLLAHVQYLRELLDLRILSGLMWLDTRDMIADGMTKGSVERTALQQLMAGHITLVNPPKLWRTLRK